MGLKLAQLEKALFPLAIQKISSSTSNQDILYEQYATL
jgi:hypothetical protein